MCWTQSINLFNLYSEMILRHFEPLQGRAVGGQNVNNLRYAADTAFITGSERKLQEELYTVVESSRRKCYQLM